MENLISVIVPVYNTGESLKRCVESILSSTYENIEVILVDDGSRADTAILCDECAYKSRKVRVFHRNNGGVSAARNFGMSISRGEFITFVDADDSVEKEMLTELYNLCIAENADLGIAGYRECLPDQTLEFHNKAAKWENEDILRIFLMEHIIGWNVWGKLYRREILEGINFPLGRRAAEDMFFLYQVSKRANCVVYKDSVLYNYLKNDDSVMSGGNIEKFFDIIELINVVKNDELTEYPQLKVCQECFYSRYALWFMRFLIARAKSNEYREEILTIRRELLGCSDRAILRLLSRKNQVEYIMFRFAFPIYSLFARLFIHK